MWTWIKQQIDEKKDLKTLILSDPHRIIRENDAELSEVAEKYGFVVISASTNLVFRELLLHAQEDKKKDSVD